MSLLGSSGNDGVSGIYQALTGYQSFLNQLGSTMGSQPGMSHIGTVRDFRKKFKEYNKAEFRHISKEPMIKDILSGMTKLNKEQIIERVKEHLDN